MIYKLIHEHTSRPLQTHCLATVVVADHTSGETGQAVGLQLPAQHLHLFAQDTGLRLDAATAVSAPLKVAAN